MSLKHYFHYCKTKSLSVEYMQDLKGTASKSTLIYLQELGGSTHLFKTDFGSVYDVGSIPLEVWVSFVFEHKHNISWNVLRCLISLLREGDLGPFFPASLDDNIQDFVFCPRCSSIWVEAAASNAHAFSTSMEDFLQRYPQLVYQRRILYLPPGVAAAVQRFITRPSTCPTMEPIETVEAKVAEGAEWVIISIHVNVHIMVSSTIAGVPMTSRAKENIKGVRAAKERCKCGMWISMEGVVIRSAWSTG